MKYTINFINKIKNLQIIDKINYFVLSKKYIWLEKNKI